MQSRLAALLRRARRGGIVGLLLTVGLLLGGVVGLDHLMFNGSAPGFFVREHPSPGFESQPVPLGDPPPEGRGGHHRFIAHQADGEEPVAYDPCRPVHYVIRPDHAPPGGNRVVHRAVARIERATGLDFRYDGRSGEDPAPHRKPFQPDRYGDRWAPVLVTWVTVAEVPRMAGRIAGQAGSVSIDPVAGPTVYVTGSVELDAVQLADLLAAPRRADEAYAVVLHELGHLVGLDHVRDPDQLMYPSDVGVLRLAPGDRAGLRTLGMGRCAPML
jgi:hypothetical protein